MATKSIGKLEGLVRLAEKVLRGNRNPLILREALRDLLQGKEEYPLEQLLDRLLEVEETVPHITAFTIYHLMVTANTREIFFTEGESDKKSDAVALMGLIPVCVKMEENQDPRQIARCFLTEKLQRNLLRERALDLGLVNPGDGLFFLPILPFAEEWPTSWIQQYELTEDLLAYFFEYGESLRTTTEEQAKTEFTEHTETPQTLSMVLPFLILAPTDSDSRLLDMILKGMDQFPEVLARWEILSSYLEREFLEIPGVGSVEILPPGLQMEVLGDLVAAENKAQIGNILESLRLEKPGEPIQVFAKATSAGNQVFGEWRLLFQAGNSWRGMSWGWMDDWEQTEDAIVGLLLSQGVSSDMIHIDEEISKPHEILDCPECGSPYFFREAERVPSCQHDIPEAASWQ